MDASAQHASSHPGMDTHVSEIKDSEIKVDSSKDTSDTLIPNKNPKVEVDDTKASSSCADPQSNDVNQFDSLGRDEFTSEFFKIEIINVPTNAEVDNRPRIKDEPVANIPQQLTGKRKGNDTDSSSACDFKSPTSKQSKKDTSGMAKPMCEPVDQSVKSLPNTEGQNLPNTEGQNLADTEGQNLADTEGQNLADTEGQNLPNIEGQNLPNTEGQNLPNTEGQNLADTEGQNLPNTEGQNLPNTEGQNLPNTEGQNLPNTEGQNLPNTKGQNLPNTEGQNLPNTEGQNLPNTEGQNLPITEGPCTDGPLLQLPTSAAKTYTRVDLTRRVVWKGPYKRYRVNLAMFWHQALLKVLGDSHTLPVICHDRYIRFPLLRGPGADMNITTKDFYDCIAKRQVTNGQFILRDNLGIIQLHKLPPVRIQLLPPSIWCHFMYRYLFNVGESGLFNAVTDSGMNFVFGIDMEEHRMNVKGDDLLSLMFTKLPRSEICQEIRRILEKKQAYLSGIMGRAIDTNKIQELATHYEVEFNLEQFNNRLNQIRNLLQIHNA